MTGSSEPRSVGRRWVLRLAMGAAATAAVAWATGCESDAGDSSNDGGGSAGGDGGSDRPLTAAEAALLAGCLFKNYDAGGARFSVAAAFQISGDTLQLEGVIDWKGHVGHATVRAVGAEAAVTDVYWTESSVLEHRTGLTEALAADGSPPYEYVDRDPDPAGRQLDGLLALVLGLAAEQRDNPQLVQQNASARFVRTDTVHDVPVSVLRYDTAELWLDSTGTMLRYSGTSADGNRPVTIDFTDRAPVSIEPPPTEAVVSYDDIAGVYDALLRQD